VVSLTPRTPLVVGPADSAAGGTLLTGKIRIRSAPQLSGCRQHPEVLISQFMGLHRRHVLPHPPSPRLAGIPPPWLTCTAPLLPTPPRLLLQSILQGLNGPLLPNTSVAKALTAAVAKTTTESATTGRKLLQGGRGNSGSSSQRNNMWATKNTQSAIRAAASGRTPASYATAAGSRNARNAASRCVNCSWKF
jgi:hypothetical protein